MLNGEGVLIDGRRSHFSPATAASAIWEMEQRGYSREMLRWRLSRAQVIGLIAYLSTDSALRDIERGSILMDSGMFCGVPYFVDGNLKPDEAELDVVAGAQVLAKIHNLNVTAAWEHVHDSLKDMGHA